MTYTLLNLYFLLPAALLLLGFFRLVNWKALGLTLVVLLIATAIFDNFIVGAGIVGYDEELISGVLLGYAPIEDFGYTIFAAIVIPICWWLLGRKQAK